MLCNAIRDPAAMSEPAIASTVNHYLKRIEDAYAHCLKSATVRGEILLTKRQAIRYSRMLLGAHVSILVLARANQGIEVARDIADGAWNAVIARRPTS